LEIGKIDKPEQGEVSAWVTGSLCLFLMVCVNVSCRTQVDYGTLVCFSHRMFC